MRTLKICSAVLFVSGTATLAVYFLGILDGTHSIVGPTVAMGTSAVGAVLFVLTKWKVGTTSESDTSGASGVRSEQQREIDEFSRMY